MRRRTVPSRHSVHSFYKVPYKVLRESCVLCAPPPVRLWERECADRDTEWRPLSHRIKSYRKGLKPYPTVRGGWRAVSHRAPNLAGIPRENSRLGVCVRHGVRRAAEYGALFAGLCTHSFVFRSHTIHPYNL